MFLGSLVSAALFCAFGAYVMAHASAAAQRRQQARMLMILEYIPA
jgi:hypothetical protein